MQFVRALFALLFLAVSFAPVYASDTAEQGNRHKGIAITEEDKDAQGNRRVSVTADGAEITDLLKDLFKLSGEQFVIDQDVSGPVDLRIRYEPFSEVYRRIAESAKPPLKIKMEGKLYRVSREVPLTNPGSDSNVPTGIGIVPLKNGPIPNGITIPMGYGQLVQGIRPVTLDVPEDRPIPMAEALDRISRQTGVNLRLDRRIPRDISFYGTITNGSLMTVVDAIARTAKFKVIQDQTGIIFTPTDLIGVNYNNVLVGIWTDTPCRNCGTRLVPTWKLCPMCGQTISRAPSNTRPSGSKMQKINRQN